MARPPDRQGKGDNARGNGAAVRSELLQEVNDRIREVGREGIESVRGLEFVCECGGGECEALVELTLTEYDRIRLGSDFVLALGHARS